MCTWSGMYVHVLLCEYIYCTVTVGVSVIAHALVKPWHIADIVD